MVLLSFILIFIYILNIENDWTTNSVIDEEEPPFLLIENGREPDPYELEEEEKINEEQGQAIAGIHRWVGQSQEALLESFGEPDRRDFTQYDYEWWVYFEGKDRIQFALSLTTDKIVSVFTNSNKYDLAHVSIGDSYQRVNEFYDFVDTVSLTGNRSSYQFELKEEEVQMYPLAQIGDIWVLYYFDVVVDSLSSVRFLDQETLLLLRPYSIVYRGELPMIGELTEDEWAMVQAGQAKQIFELTNDLRERHGLSSVEWHDATAEVALLHSKDMFENEYFSHTSPDHGELKDRLQAEEVSFQRAAENIAAYYVDGIAAVEGWLNSEGHRVNLFNEEFTHLGVGVYRSYYTQNFMMPW